MLKAKKGKDDIFTQKIFFSFFAPTLAASIAMGLGNIVDSLVVGAKMSETGLAAISIVTPVFMFFNLFDIAFSTGGSISFLRLLGEGKPRKAKDSFNNALAASLVVSGLIAVIGSIFLGPILAMLGTVPSDGEVYAMAHSYARVLIAAAPLYFLSFLFYYFVRADDDAKRASVGFIVGNAADIVLSAVFVLVFNFGVEGAIWGSVIGKICAILIYLPHFFKKYNILGFWKVTPDLAEIKNIFTLGFSSSAQYLFQFAGLTVLNHIMMRVGGENAVAVYAVVTNVSYVVFSAYDCAASTLQTLAATFRGEKNAEAEEAVKQLSFTWGTVIGAALALLCALFAQPICRLFGLTAAMDWGAISIYAFALSSIFAGQSLIQQNYFQAIFEEKRAFAITFLRSFVLYLACAFIFSHLSTRYFFFFITVAEVLTFIIWKAKAPSSLADVREYFDQSRVFKVVIDTDTSKLDAMLDEVEAFSQKWDATPKQLIYLRTCVEELCALIITKGLGNVRDGYIGLVLIALPDGDFELHLRDNAKRFNPFDVKTSKADDDDFDIDNVGILMVKSRAKEFSYRTLQGFNSLVVRV